MNSEEYDVVVLGGGPAGYSFGIRAALEGMRVAVIEREHLGGVCLNWGCIPSKALITTAERLTWAREGRERGLMASDAKIDLNQASAYNRSVVRHHVAGVEALFVSNGVRLIRGVAKVLSPSTVRVVGSQGEEFELLARKAVVLATGATPRELPGFQPDGSRILTAREAIFLSTLPEHLIVLGGGVIGLELGSAYRSLGSRVTIVELGPTLLPSVDPDLVRVAARELQTAGIPVLLGTRALRYRHIERGVEIDVEAGGQRTTLEGDAVMVAAGFSPNTQNLGLEQLGVVLSDSGHVVIDDRCQTNIPGVYAIGDVSGPPYLAHKAYKEAEMLTEILTNPRAIRDFRALPSVIFCRPELATVGMSEMEARARGLDVNIGKFPFSALGRAQAMGETRGFVKLIAAGDRLVGAGVVGHGAGELIAELTFAIETGATLEDLALTIHSHPTLSEAIREAAEQGLGRSVHILNRKTRRGGARVDSATVRPH